MTRLSRLAPSRLILLVLGIFGLSRLWSSAILLALFVFGPSLGLPVPAVRDADASFFDFLSGWDGVFYHRIIRDGYPTSLPLNDAGNVTGNAWAFLPVFPLLVGAFSALTQASLASGSVVIATLAGGAASVALFELVRPRVGARAALWTVVFFAFGPLGFLLQVGYAESLFVFFLFSALVAMSRHRYWPLLAFGLAAAFTRPGVLALALALGIHVLLRLVRRDVFPLREKCAAVVSGGLLAVAGFAWPWIAGLITGRSDAYLQTEMSWWEGYVGREVFLPLTPWFRMFGTYLGLPGLLVPLLAAALFVAWLRRRSLRTMGSDLIAWAGSYALYLFAVFLPQQSIFRLVLLPLAPLFGEPALTGSRRRRAGVLTACLALQPVCATVLWFATYP